MFLFNDLLIITSYRKESSILKMSDKYAIHQGLTLDHMAIHPKSVEEPDNPCAFDIHMPDRVYTIIAQSESDRRIWLEEIEMALYAWHHNTPKSTLPGWQHETVLGTIYADAFSGNLTGVSSHIENGVNVNATDGSGMNPLHWAALRGHGPIVKLLLEHGCDVDALNNGLNSALLIAAAKGHDHIVRLLLEKGSDVTVRNLKDRDVLFMATLYGHSTKGLSNILHVLHFNHLDFDQVDSSGATPLHECALRNLPRPIHFLVHGGADVNVKHGRTGVTPLQLACTLENPNVETVRSLLDNGAHPNWKDSSGQSAFTMMLTAQTPVSPSQAATGGGNGESLNEDMTTKMNKYSNWVQNALPVLMELVRKGGRYTEESIVDLRDSFKVLLSSLLLLIQSDRTHLQAAIDSARIAWLSSVVPENFDDFINAKGQMIGNVQHPSPSFLLSSVPSSLFASPSSKEWVEDKAAPHCLLCVERFTYSNRRHHCRSCGTLCCAPCSSKRLPLQLRSSRSRSSSSSNGAAGGSGDRVCDGCYNRLLSEAATRNIALAKAKKELLLQREREKELDEKHELMNGAATSPASSPSETDPSGSPGGGLSGLKDTLGELGEALNERGEKLQNLSRKGGELESVSAISFSSLPPHPPTPP
jgi:ankyrin repeat protein